MAFAHPPTTAAAQAPPNNAPTLSTRSPSSESSVKTLTSGEKPRFFTPLIWDRSNSKWQATATVDGKKKYFGLFDDEEKAWRAVVERTGAEQGAGTTSKATSEFAPALEALTVDEIQSRVERREEARSRRDFHNADLMLKELTEVGEGTHAAN